MNLFCFSFGGRKFEMSLAGTSLVVQWLRLCTPNAQVRSLVRELDPTCHN